MQEVIRKKINLTLPEEPVANPELFQTLSSKEGTYENYSAEKSIYNTLSNGEEAMMEKEELDDQDDNCEILSNYITETDQSQLKSQQILNYLINDFADFLIKRNESKRQEFGGSNSTGYHTSEISKDEWFEECQEKITHIEDIIKRLPDETRSDFMKSSQSKQLKQLMEIVRNNRKEYMLSL